MGTPKVRVVPINPEGEGCWGLGSFSPVQMERGSGAPSKTGPNQDSHKSDRGPSSIPEQPSGLGNFRTRSAVRRGPAGGAHLSAEARVPATGASPERKCSPGSEQPPPPPRVATVVPEAVIWGWRRTGMVPKRPRPYVRAPGSAGPCVGECGHVAPCTCADVAVHAADDKSEGHWVPVLTKQDWPCPPGAPGPRKGADKNQIPLERGGLSGPVAREVERGQLTSSEGSGGDSQSVTCGKSMPDSGNSTH